MTEFEMIKRYFTRPSTRSGARAALGVGDDCALLLPPLDQQIAISTDMLVSGRHFLPDTAPYWLGHKALAVNLSDLAAMGAIPIAFTLALSLPELDEAWLKAFSDGLCQLAEFEKCELIGGDTTRGPLNICITVFGQVTPGLALRRNGARVGDDIWVSGTLGDARLALAALQGEVELSAADLITASERLHAPTPRLALGYALRQIAHSAIDISDGLIGDLGHILEASDVGAKVHLVALPVGPVLEQQDLRLQWDYMVTGGDDYELCFTAPTSHREQVLQAASKSGTPIAWIGRITADTGITWLDEDGVEQQFGHSFDHFR